MFDITKILARSIHIFLEAYFAAFLCFLAVAEITFSDSACAGLLVPGNGDALSLADSLTPKA